MKTGLHAHLSPSSTESRIPPDPVVFCAADEAYVMPLAVTLSSAARNLSMGRSLRVFVLDTGISEPSWQGLCETLVDLSVELHQIRTTTDGLRHLSTSHHISHTAFVRLLAARWLPADIDRAIYLDSDLVLRGDLNELWQTELKDSVCAAVPDIACPYIDARRANCNFRRSSPYMATLSPVRNWRALDLDPAAHYFNSGVLLIDLNAWRREDLGDAFLKCLADHRRHVWCWDQYALNVVLAERWIALPLRWNQGTHAFEYPSVLHAPVNADDFREMIERPALIHFTTEFKPWNFGSRHPQRQAFAAALQETAWADWRPQRPAASLQRTCQSIGVVLQKQATIASRKFTALFHGFQRDAAAGHAPSRRNEPAMENKPASPAAVGASRQHETV